MKKLIKGVGVDAGIILICDAHYYKKYDNQNFDDRISTIIKIKPGTYRVNWNIDNTWNGGISGNGILKIESGKMIVSDPCYCIKQDKWDNWISDTDIGEIEPNGCILINSMGGDGIYNIKLNIDSIEEL